MKNKLNLFRQYAGGLVKFLFTITFLLTLCVGQMWADNAGFFDTGAGIITYSKNSGSDTNHSVNKTGASTSDFGTVTSFWLKGWQIKMWKNNGGNVCDYGKLYYRIYLTSGSGGSYTELNKASTTWSVPNTNHIYHNGGSLNTNLLSGLVGGVYYFEFYFKAQGNWNSGSGCDDQYLSNGSSNYKIKFKYDPKYTVTVSAGSNGSVASTSVTAGNIDAVTLPTATANTGYHFNNWTTASSNLTLGNTTSATTGTVKARAAATVTANFAENTYSLTFSHNGHGTIKVGGSTISSGSTASVNYYTTKTLVATPSTGYNFSGWTKSGTNTSAVTIGNAANASTTIKATNTGATVTAGFTAKTYSITLDGNGGSEGSATATYNSSTLTSVTHSTRASYDRDGYFTETSGGTKIINADGSLVSNVTGYTDASGNWIYDDDIVLHAQWTYNPTMYLLKFGARSGEMSYGQVTAINSSTSASLTTNTSYLAGTGVTATAVVDDEDYKFDSWYDAWTSGSEVSTDNPYSFTLDAATSVYAHFVRKTTSITLNKGIGSGGTAGPVTATHGSNTLSPSISVNPSKSGYTFTGYWTEPSGGIKVIGTDGALMANVSGYTKSSNNKWDYDDASLTLYAQYTENMTTVTVNVSPASTGTLTVGGAAFTPGNTTTAGVSTSRTVVATAANDYAFSSWGVTGNATGTSSTNTYTLKGNGSAGTGTLTANFTLVPCSLQYGSSTPLNSPSSAVMSYDLEAEAYYIDVTTNSSPYYFRFLRDSKEWSGNWNSYPDVNAVTANGSKVACATETQGWGNKASIKYVGNSGTSIRIWFDYQNQKTWITADKDKEYVLRGYKYDDSEAGGMPGWSATTTYFDGLASGNTGTITATLSAATKYKFKVYDRYTDAWYGNSTNNAECETADGTLYATGTGTNNNFYFTTTISGTYTFTVDKSSGLKVKVDYPVSYQLNYDIGTVKGTSGSISTDPTTASGSYVPSGNTVTLTAPSEKTGYTWKGWYGAAGGTGDQLCATKAYTITMNAAKTLYACYTENEYPVTVSTGANGDVSPKGTVNVKQISGTNLTATPNTGYSFSSWTISGGGITPGTSSTSPQTFKATETGGSIQANFAEDMHTVNVASNNTAFGTVSTSSVSAGIATASTTITATPATGATFTGWTLPGSGVTIVAPATTSSTSITIKAAADSKSITANFSETKHTVTLTNQNSTYGDVNTSSPVSVGQITAVQIQATPKSGYMLSGWVKTSGDGTVTYHTAAGTGKAVDPTGNTQATTYITVDDDVTLQATWEEDRSSGWYMRGNWTDGWTTSGQKAFVKDVGEGSGTVSHVRWTLDPRNFTNATMQMKMYDGFALYGHWSDFDADANLCTKDNGNNANIGFYPGDENKNFRISISVYGEYDFEWDSSTKQLTVHYPEGNFIRGDFNSWGWEDELTATGEDNEYAKTISLDANQTWTAGDDGFKMVILGDHYGRDGTTITRASNSASDLSRSGANIGLTTDVAGDYTFTINTSTKNLSVTYPTAYTVTYGYGVGGSAVSASATSRAGSFASGGYVADGDDVTFSQTPAAGYTFKGWYTTADGNATVPTMGESDNVLNGLSGNATVYAQYTPTTYTNVTLNATTGSTNGAYSVTFGGTTITVTTDPLKTGYEPEGFYESYADGNWTNKIAASDGTLQSGTTYTDATGHWKATNSPTLYTKWQPKTYTVTLDKNGSSAGYLTNGSVTATYDSNTLTSLTVPARTGYHLVDGYYKEPGLTNKIINLNGTLCTSTAYTDASGNWTNDGDVTLYAKWAPNIYTITFDPADGSVDPTSASVTFDAAVSNAPVPTRTGYTFTGYNTAGGASITTNAGVFKSSVDGFTDGSAHWVQPDDATITAQWTPNPYTITLTQSTETGYGSAGTTSVGATYDAALPTIASLPTAANGYAFMGYFTDHNGVGTQYYDADGTKLVASYTTADDLELFAYFKKAEITAITFSPAAVVAPNATITATPTISPTPTGTTSICWRVLYSNDNPLDPQPTMTPGEGNSVSFSAKETSGTYKVEAVLHLGGECKGTTLDSVVANFLVAGDHEVTVQYKDASGNTLQASGTVTGKPLEWSAEAITAPDIFGYTFARWEAGDGVTISTDATNPIDGTSTTTEDIYIKAIYDGRLTAVYNQNQIIYFKNTLGWDNVFVNFHAGDAWNNTNNPQGSPKGVGNSGLTNANKHMTRIGDTDVWYYDYGYNNGGSSISPSLYISFTDQSRPSASEFWGANPGINVSYPANYSDAISTDKSSETGFKAATPMFVPLAPQDPVAKNVNSTGKANYYNSGYWTTYTAGTGYTLEIYYDNDGSACIYSIPFTSADDLMPMTAKVDLEASTTYRYQVRRGGTESAGIYYGNTGTMMYDNRGDGTGWIMENTMAGGFKKAKITTNASGDYTFNLSYSANNESEYRLRMKVDYPIANNDYRLVYSDATQTKPIISAIVTKANNSKDTVSFFVRPASAALVIQQATVTKEGAITWNAYSTITSNVDNAGVDALSKDSVYNICLTMDGSGAISVENVEAYTGNFYIRTNAAGSSKWDNFRSSDHLMTYSEYSAKNSDYSHYFMAYVGNTTNIKFVVANDYAPNISDTVIVQTYRGGDASHVDEDGNIKADANVRFMWNRHNNGAYRAYLAAAKSDESKFLVLRANSSTDMMDENGNALIYSANSGEAGYNHKAPDNSIQFVDDDNWIYKATVKVKPSAFVKLYAYFNGAYFYYKGKNNDDFNAENAIQLMTGTGEAEKIHVIYDFKTDRLVAAWMPSGNISEKREINADVMFVREHQGDIEQLTFTGSGAITDIKTAYAVLRFNKWTLNNKSKAAGHAVLNPGASRYERDLFYVSFPFRVSMEEVFGFGKYGQHWIVEEYDGEARAANGFWADTPSYWRFITNRKGKFFEPNKGYIIALDLDELGESSDVWNNGVENVELYFPSYGTMGNITNATVEHTLPAHAYDPAAHPTHTEDRSIKDSHWNVMSVPTYVNTSDVTFANTTWTASKPSFLYEWNMDDNSLTARSGSGYTYHAMHAYIVQYAGKVTWTSTSVTPASIVARRTYAEAPSEVEFCLELKQNEKTADHTFVRLSNDEEVSAGFAFGEDMSKEFNKTRSNIYTFIGTEQVAGNIMPMTEQTTVVPVGVIAKTAGDYTFAIPEGTNGVGVTLIDIETGIRTPLSALDYTVNLGAGTYNERFVLEISPVQQTPTGIENSEVSHQHSDVRKVLIDGILYIVKDGKMFDATGALVK